MTNNRLFLLDAFALIYRAYFAFSKNPLVNSKGMNVSAIQGFTNTLLDIIKKENPTHIAVCFDTAAPTERHIDFADYKADRQEQPEDITLSLPYIRSIIEALNIPVIEKDGYEADDVIGTLAKRAEKDGYKVYMVTPDKDYGQLVSDNIFIYKPPHLGNTYQIIGPEQIKQRWEINDVSQVIDILGLMGDAVDNIPGLPGVGEKTAKKLVAEFGSIEGLIARAGELKGKLQETVIQQKDLAILSKKLATIMLDVPVEWDEKATERSEPDKEKLKEIFTELEFRTLGKRILGDDFNVTRETPRQQTDLFGEAVTHNFAAERTVTDGQQEELVAEKNISNTSHQYHLTDTVEKIADLIHQLSGKKEFCFDTEATGVNANTAEIVGLSFSFKPTEAFYVPVPANRNEAEKILNMFKPVLENESILKIGQNIKYDMLLLRWYNIQIKGSMFDTMLAHYLLEPDLRHGMDYLAETYLGYIPVSITELIGKGKKQLSMRDVDVNKVSEYAAEDADITLQLKDFFAPQLKEKEVEKLFTEVEMPLVEVLTDMEYEGVAVDKNFLNDYSVRLEKEIVQTEKEVYELAGVRFNLASPKQLGEVLFEKIKIPYSGKKTRTGQYSTDEDTLSKLTAEYPIAAKLMDYRELTKLKSTYVDAIPMLLNPKTGRVHTSFNQAVASTGRLSSTEPNLQNIPIRTERGREIRKAFIPRSADYVILSADYSQIELRIIAGLSRDENMLNAFKEGHDIHAATAAKVFGVDMKEVTREMRSKAKAVNFGIAYGQTAFGLSQGLGISKAEAKEIIDNYNQKFPGVRRLMDKNIAFARKHGYVETILGRRRTLKDINSGNATVRNFAERLAINAPIQGSAADMIKVAMINIYREFSKHNFKSKMTLQVHDELVFDAHPSELEKITSVIKDKMIHAIELNVPIDVGIGIGANWLDAH